MWTFIGIVILVALWGPLLALLLGKVDLAADWRTADRSPTGIAPDPAVTTEAVVQVYAARAFNWRGMFGTHTWIATKPEGASQFTVHQVLGWMRFQGLPVVVSATDIPDRSWYGHAPVVIADLRGEHAARAIPAVEEAVRRYPFASHYLIWPGPNSNTFTAYVGRQVPALRLELPNTAIGKDYLTDGRLVARAPSGTGVQISLGGVLGIVLAWREGMEVNLLGLNFGLDPLGPAISLPGLGRIGLRLDRLLLD